MPFLCNFSIEFQAVVIVTLRSYLRTAAICILCIILECDLCYSSAYRIICFFALFFFSTYVKKKKNLTYQNPIEKI